MNLNSVQNSQYQLEVGTPNGAWIQVAGCMDLGADGNEAPIKANDYATNMNAMLFPRTYRLQNDKRIPAGYQSLMKVRVQIDSQAISFGNIPFHFIDHPN